MITIRYYRRVNGEHPFHDWLTTLSDKRTRAAVLRRIDRLADGNVGERRSLRDGVSEMKIDIGPGYRLYYAQQGKTVVLLLCAGSKRTQRQDIARAVEYWKDYQSRT